MRKPSRGEVVVVVVVVGEECVEALEDGVEVRTPSSFFSLETNRQDTVKRRDSRGAKQRLS